MSKVEKFGTSTVGEEKIDSDTTEVKKNNITWDRTRLEPKKESWMKTAEIKNIIRVDGDL